MSKYYAYQCKKCKRFYMSTSKKYSKCAYCGSSSAEFYKEGKPKDITVFVQQHNAMPYIRRRIDEKEICDSK